MGREKSWGTKERERRPRVRACAHYVWAIYCSFPGFPVVRPSPPVGYDKTHRTAERWGIGGWGVPTPARRRCRETPGGCRENTESAETPGKPGAQRPRRGGLGAADASRCLLPSQGSFRGEQCSCGPSSPRPLPAPSRPRRLPRRGRPPPPPVHLFLPAFRPPGGRSMLRAALPRFLR